MITLTRENVDNMEEAKKSQFGFNGVVGVIRDKDIVVGFYNIWIDEPQIKLEELEIIDEYQEQGYGTQFLKILFEEYPDCTEITGISLEDSVGFYENFNIEFSTTCEECNVESCCYHPNSLEDREGKDMCDDYSGYAFKIMKDKFFALLDESLKYVTV